MKNSTALTIEQRLARHKQADKIIADYQRQHNYVLPQPWVEAVGTLLLRGLTDIDLHLLFETMMRVDFEAGRIPDAPPPKAPID